MPIWRGNAKNWGTRMTEKEMKNKELDACFQALRDTSTPPSSKLLARVLADAEAELAKRVPLPPARAGLTWWREFLRAVGGWPAMAGLATATFAGLWIGVSPEGILPDATSAYLGLNDAAFAVDVAPDLGFDLIEEAL